MLLYIAYISTTNGLLIIAEKYTGGSMNILYGVFIVLVNITPLIDP